MSATSSSKRKYNSSNSSCNVPKGGDEADFDGDHDDNDNHYNYDKVIAEQHNDEDNIGGAKVLALPEDEAYLDEVHCLLRLNIEIFEVTSKDITTSVDPQELTVGQVGVRCRHCRHVPRSDGRPDAVTYPVSITGIYQCVTVLHQRHFPQCGYVPDRLQQTLHHRWCCGATLRGGGDGGTKKVRAMEQYYIRAASMLGLVDASSNGTVGAHIVIEDDDDDDDDDSSIDYNANNSTIEDEEILDYYKYEGKEEKEISINGNGQHNGIYTGIHPYVDDNKIEYHHSEKNQYSVTNTNNKNETKKCNRNSSSTSSSTGGKDGTKAGNKTANAPATKNKNTSSTTNKKATTKKLQKGTQEFSPVQNDSWLTKYEQLVDYRLQHGHCLVPNKYHVSPSLAEWVKRQRYQHKQKLLGNHSSMSDDRVVALTKINFVWNSHDAVWEERYNELVRYTMENGGRTTVPSTYEPNKQLAIWIKRQRRQYKFMMDDNGKNHTMTPYRLKRLNSVNFSWDGRKRERGRAAGRDDCTVIDTKVNKKAKLVKEQPKQNLRRSMTNTNEMKKPARILPCKPATVAAVPAVKSSTLSGRATTTWRRSKSSKAVVLKSNIPIMAFSANNDDTIVLNANEDEEIDENVINTDDDDDDNYDDNEDDEDIPNSNDDDDLDHADEVYDDVLSTNNDYDDADNDNHNDEIDDDNDSIVI